MKLDPTVMRTMNRQDFRVLEAVESGMKNHQLVPLKLVCSIANLRHGGVTKIISSLLRDKLLSHENTCGYDGYRLTNSGYDVLALHALKTAKVISALGNVIGTGKESDVYLAASPTGKQIVLKFHRLGRTSFRNVKKKRDYFNTCKKLPETNSWLFLSKISAKKEYCFMKALWGVDYPTPQPLYYNRHVVCMSVVRGIPLYQIHSLSQHQAASIFQQSCHIIKRLAQQGLVHCDLNEFNLLVDLSGIQETLSHNEEVEEYYVRHSGVDSLHKGALSSHSPLEKHVLDGTGEVITEEPPSPQEFLENSEPKPVVKLIDFPQMISTHHPNAQELFERDLECLKRFFVKKLKCIPEGGWDDDDLPKWEDVAAIQQQDADDERDSNVRLDQDLKASGFSDMDATRDLELYYYNNEHHEGIVEETVVDEYEEDGEESDVHGDDDQGLESDGVDSDGDSIPGQQHQDKQEHDLTVIDTSLLQAQSRAAAEEKARARVRRQLEDAKKKRGKQGAFRSKNSNKTYVKGKRVMNDVGY